MKYCTKCGGRVSDHALFCPNCGCFSIGKKSTKNPFDKINIGLCLIPLLLSPLVGFIYWGVQRKKKPRCAKAMGIAAIIGWVISLILVMYTLTL